MWIFSPFYFKTRRDSPEWFSFISSLLMCDDGTEVQFGLLFAALAPAAAAAAARGRGAAGLLEPSNRRLHSVTC